MTTARPAKSPRGRSVGRSVRRTFGGASSATERSSKTWWASGSARGSLFMRVRPEDLPAAPTGMTRPMASGVLGFLLGTSPPPRADARRRRPLVVFRDAFLTEERLRLPEPEAVTNHVRVGIAAGRANLALVARRDGLAAHFARTATRGSGPVSEVAKDEERSSLDLVADESLQLVQRPVRDLVAGGTRSVEGAASQPQPAATDPTTERNEHVRLGDEPSVRSAQLR